MRIVFMGTPESAVPSLKRLVDEGHEIVAVWTQPDKPAGRGKKLHASPVKQFALEHNLLVHQPHKIKTNEATELFASHQADVAVVVAYGKILTNEFLDAPTHGCINVHFSLLPKYRGAAPVNWAIVNGEEQTGVTTMNIVAELDAGPILLQRATRIDQDETAPQLLNRLAELGAELLNETLANLSEITPKPQTGSEATFAPMLKREDGLIDWSMDAFAIANRVRGFQPWPSAFTIFRSRRLIVWAARSEWIEQLRFPPGQIIEASRGRLIVACGEGTALRLSVVQLQDSRRMSARDFLNGTRINVGEMIDSNVRP
ncbi:MAG TPA: methionyl-tRNA formyltransferase [Pyrinomonadaceae bacterium]|jgi:methionyl-tRNA formyltransferase|nr:methionyl-tRNA formyltransferase [Pyrinomonadaceae bacterium]